MRSTRWIVLLVMSLSFGCGEAEEASEDDDTVEAPEPVAPLEVATPEEGESAEGVDPPDDGETTADPATAEAETPETMESLRARVAELEAQLASCQGGTTPEGVDVPTTDNSTASAGTTAARRQGEGSGSDTNTNPNNRGLLGALLGPDEPAEDQQGRGRQGGGNDPQPLELPDPTRILLGP